MIESLRNYIVSAALLINSLNVVFVVWAFVEFTDEETSAWAMKLHTEPMQFGLLFCLKTVAHMMILHFIFYIYVLSINVQNKRLCLGL